MVDEKTHPNYLSLLSYIIYYIIRAFGTHNVIYYVLEQGHVIWIRFFIHHTNKPECQYFIHPAVCILTNTIMFIDVGNLYLTE